jgi:hypothetical protein
VVPGPFRITIIVFDEYGAPGHRKGRVTLRLRGILKSSGPFYVGSAKRRDESSARIPILIIYVVPTIRCVARGVDR